MTTAVLAPSAVTIREATEADVPRLVEMGTRFQAETVYHSGPAWDADQMAQTAHGLIASDDGLFLVAERDGVVVGMFGAVIFTHPISAERTVSELCFWIDPEHRGCGVRLLRRAEQWADGRGAVEMVLIAPTPEVERFYQQLGYIAKEVSYGKRL